MIFFTSDQHFGHENVIKFCNRPFANATEMNAELIRRHNEVVKSDDIVYHLGDFSMSKSKVAGYLRQLNGTHLLVPGNHDACHQVQSKTTEKMNNAQWIYINAGFIIRPEQIHLLIAGRTVTLCHFPYLDQSPETEAYELRFKDLRPKDEGGWLLCGHVHQHWKVKGRQINVGVDVWDYRPVAVTEIERIINEQI